MFSLPAVAEAMRAWDQDKPEERSYPSPGIAAKTATIPDRPSHKVGKKRQSNGTFTPDGLSNNLPLNLAF